MYSDGGIVYNNGLEDKFTQLKNLMGVGVHFNGFYSSLSTVDARGQIIYDILKRIIIEEEILNQNNMGSPVRLYSWKEMVDVQDFLLFLYLIEAISYSPYRVNARRLLREYLYTKYDFRHCDVINVSGRINKLSSITDHVIDVSGKKEIACFDKNLESCTKSVRNYLNEFLYSYLDISAKKYADDKNVSGYEKECNLGKKRFYIPVYDVPEMLMEFTYKDGRDFEHCDLQKNKNKIPTRKDKLVASIYSYQKAMKIMVSLRKNGISAYNKYMESKTELYRGREELEKNPIPDNFYRFIAIFFRCDKKFFFLKLEKLFYYYQLYQEDFILSEIVHKYRLNYHQILKLGQVIKESIFGDRDFITKGLESCYLDFMLPFDIMFQFQVFGRTTSNIRGDMTGLKSDIEEIKKVAKMLYSIEIHSMDFNTKIRKYFGPDRELKVRGLQKAAWDNLETNTFFLQYYQFQKIERGGLDTFSNEWDELKLDDYFIDFHIIKNILEHPRD